MRLGSGLRHFLFPFLFLYLGLATGYGQETDDDQPDEPLIRNIPLLDKDTPPDSNYVELLPNLWSIRVLGVVKNQGNSILNRSSGTTVRYRPTNTFPGAGFTYKFLLVDLGVNLKLNKEDVTQRFDFQGTIMGRKYIIDAFIQVYQGYQLVNAAELETRFRDDLQVSQFGVNFVRTFGGAKLSLRSAFIGSEIQKKAVGSFVAGGFFSNFHLRADSSVVPVSRARDFNEYAQIDQIDLLNFGVSAGYAYAQVFPKHYILFLAVLPGLGLNFGDVHAQKWYKPPVGPFGKVHLRVALGRSSVKNYQILSFSSDFFFMDFGHQNLYRYSFGKIKLVYGFRLENNKNPLKKVL